MCLHDYGEGGKHVNISSSTRPQPCQNSDWTTEVRHDGFFQMTGSALYSIHCLYPKYLRGKYSFLALYCMGEKGLKR